MHSELLGSDARWQDSAKYEVHTALVPVFQTVRDESEWRIEADELHLGFYKQCERFGVRGHSLRGSPYESATLPYNVCRSAVDTLQAKVAKHRPLPQCLTQRGNWALQKRARKMTEFLEGEFYRQRIYEKHGPNIVRDALIFGRGALRIWAEGRSIKAERVHPWELFADEWDARYGSPRNMYHARTIDRGVALEAFARTKGGGWNKTIRAAIEDAGRFIQKSDMTFSGGATVDRIDVVDAWHLCDRAEEHALEHEDDGPDDGEADEDERDDGTGETVGMGARPKKHKCNGRHVVITTAGTLLDEPWEHDYFPFAVLGFNEAVTGCWATGLVEQLEGYQYELNQTSERLSEMYRLSGVAIMVPDNAKVSYQDIRNGINIIGHGPGGKPEVHQLDLVNEHMRARPRELTEDALNDCGLSQMSVQSQTPANLKSGIAIQTVDDIETERFMMFGRSYATWNVEVARRFIDCAKLIAKTQGDHSVSVPMRGGLVKMKWNDVYVEGVDIRIDPTSVLPTLLPARLDLLMQMWESQQIDRSTFLRNLETTDLQGEILTQLAPKLVVDEMIERMLLADEDEGEDAYMPPTAYQPFEWAAERAQQKYNRGLLDGAPEYNLDMLQRYIKHCQKEIEKLTPPAPMPAPANINGMAMPPAAAGGPMPANPMAGAAMPAPTPMAA